MKKMKKRKIRIMTAFPSDLVSLGREVGGKSSLFPPNLWPLPRKAAGGRAIITIAEKEKKSVDLCIDLNRYDGA